MLGKTLIAIGIGCIILGVLVLVLDKIPGMGRLPGDIVIKRENFSFYFPLATCLILSLIISLIMYFLNQR
jgi:hypothetical protein